MNEDRRALWRKVFQLTFQAWYAELLLGTWLGTWKFVDGLVAVGTAITASGSAFAGWNLWSQPGWKEVWVALAGVTALASITHTKLGIGTRMDSLHSTWSEFLDVRSDAKTLLDRMDLGLPTNKASEMFLALQERVKKAERGFKPGLLEPSSQRKRDLQERVKEKLADYTEGGNRI
jgi:hypothetical protein